MPRRVGEGAGPYRGGLTAKRKELGPAGEDAGGSTPRYSSRPPNKAFNEEFLIIVEILHKSDFYRLHMWEGNVFIPLVYVCVSVCLCVLGI